MPIIPVNKNRIPEINNGGELLTSILAEVKALDQKKIKINPIKRDFKFMIYGKLKPKPLGLKWLWFKLN